MNEVQNFIFEGLGIRGAIVRLEETWSQVLAEHRYPERVRELLGEAVAATVLLTTGLKSTPQLSLQLQGEGPITLLLIQCSSELKVRGMVQWQDASANEPLLGQGRLTVNIDTGEDSRRFQGIVPLAGPNLTDCLEEYFRQSEQLPTRLLLTGTGETVAGLLLQALPGNDVADDSFETASALASTVSRDELSTMPAAELLPKLFSEFTIRLFEPRFVAHDCRCTPEHLAGVVRMLGVDEVESLIEEAGQVEMTCEFCNRSFSFDETDITRIFAGETPGPTLH